MIIGGQILDAISGNEILKDGRVHFDFEGCTPDVKNTFVFDDVNTKAIPAVVSKNIDITFDMVGIVLDDLYLESTNIYVEWDNVKLYSGDFPIDKVLRHPGDEFKTEMTFPIPSFAPSGKYMAKVSLSG